MRRRSSTLRGHWLLLAAAVALLGCGRRARPGPAGRDGGVATPPIPHSRVVELSQPAAVFDDDLPLPVFDGIELSSAGETPRARLRYALAELSPCALTIAATVDHMQVVDAQISPAVPLPEIRYGLGFSAARAGDAGAITVDLFGRRAEVAETASAEARQLAEPQAEVFRAHVERRRGSAAVSDRGLLGEITIATLDAEEDTTRTKQEIAQILLGALVPLPEEPIGIGARWRARYRLRRGAHVVAQEATYQLIAVDGRRVRLQADIGQLGEPQWVRPGYLPAGTSAELILLRWHAEGEFEVDLGRPTPIAGKLDVLLTHHGRVKTGGQTQDLFSESKGTLILTTE